MLTVHVPLQNNLVGTAGRHDTTLSNLELTANIFTPITQGIMGLKRSDSDAQVGTIYDSNTCNCTPSLYEEIIDLFDETQKLR